MFLKLSFTLQQSVLWSQTLDHVMKRFRGGILMPRRRNVRNSCMEDVKEIWIDLSLKILVLPPACWKVSTNPFWGDLCSEVCHVQFIPLVKIIFKLCRRTGSLQFLHISDCFTSLVLCRDIWLQTTNSGWRLVSEAIETQVWDFDKSKELTNIVLFYHLGEKLGIVSASRCMQFEEGFWALWSENWEVVFQCQTEEMWEIHIWRM